MSVHLGRRGRWHEFLSRFNLVILYHKGAENEAPDALSRWAYPAGLSQDVLFHGSENDLEGWNQCVQREREYTQRKLREQHSNDLESIVLYVPVWFVTALSVLQSTYLIKLRHVSFFLRPVRLQKFVTFLMTPPLYMHQLLLILTDFTYIATLHFFNRADLLE